MIALPIKICVMFPNVLGDITATWISGDQLYHSSLATGCKTSSELRGWGLPSPKPADSVWVVVRFIAACVKTVKLT